MRSKIYPTQFPDGKFGVVIEMNGDNPEDEQIFINIPTSAAARSVATRLLKAALQAESMSRQAAQDESQAPQTPSDGLSPFRAF